MTTAINRKSTALTMGQAEYEALSRQPRVTQSRYGQRFVTSDVLEELVDGQAALVLVREGANHAQWYRVGLKEGKGRADSTPDSDVKPLDNRKEG